MILKILYTILPVAGGGILHMMVVRAKWLQFLAIPIDGGRSWSGKRIFGDHKTWRGIVVILAATALSAGLHAMVESRSPDLSDYNYVDYSTIAWWQAGLWWGIAYAISELPNSFLKRRAGIAPGEGGSAGLRSVLLSLMDQADSAIGCSLIAWLALGVPFDIALWMIILGTAVHLLINMLLGLAGLRDRII
ncbi:MAG: CDP-archaeol synthase [Planctomycetes bacterium]|nr:CDP-archaeol synthase [Planctomycetota bacterium]